jgi:hypothetical protein
MPDHHDGQIAVHPRKLDSGAATVHFWQTVFRIVRR